MNAQHRQQQQHVGACALVDFESLESRLFMRVEGVDVSLFQGSINWTTLRNNNKEFAFVRASRTNLDLDSYFHANMAGAKAAGVITGPYHRALPKGESEGGVYTDPITDANRFYNAAKDYMKEGYLRPVIDAEDGYTLGKAALSKWIMDFSMELERLSGVEPIIYANGNYATNYLDASVAARHDLWVARWNNANDPSLTNPQIDQPQTPSGYVNPYGAWNVPVGGAPSHDSWDFWQYSSRGNGPALGVSSTYLDLDVFNGDLETMRRGFLVGHQWNFNLTGSPFAVGAAPVTIQAEDYDNGGQGYAFNDTSPKVNTGGAYRTGERDGVDVSLIPNTTIHRLGDTFAGEWLEYTVNVQQAQQYQLEFRVSQSDPNALMHIDLDGQMLTSFAVPDTNSFNVFSTVSRTVALPAGKHVLRMSMDQAASNGVVAGVDWLRVTPGARTITTNTATFVRGGEYASKNYGGWPDLVTKRSNNPGSSRDSYLKFDLTTAGAISTAKLRLYGRISDTANASLVTDVLNASNTTWSENAMTWNNKPAAGSTVRGSLTVTGTGGKYYEVDLTTFLKGELAAGRKVVTLVLKNRDTSSASTIFGSDESSNAPQLVIT